MREEDEVELEDQGRMSQCERKSVTYIDARYIEKEKNEKEEKHR